jgi:antitoxin (DNA-binding transcriptional repressor) of toxin-antitoxin stability system
MRAGQTVEVRDRDKVIASIVPAKQRRRRPIKFPDFAA